MQPSRAPVILLIGSDAALNYLLERYAKHAGYEVRTRVIVPPPSDRSEVRPAAVLFSSIEDLEAAQAQIADLSSSEIPLLACTSINDQTRAHELGADHCIVHPLTYDGFCAALAAAQVVAANHLETDGEQGPAQTSN